MKDLRILLLYASYGNGHLQVSSSLYECFKLFPRIYGRMYYKTKKMQNDSLLSQWIHSFGMQKLVMSLASFVITKPGGITVSEAISLFKPMLLFRPVPGQERENAKYLADKGAALISLNSS
jgi:UDP-N-acetylglucosamine:LPS N-acetylglucosamine transferase